MKTINVKLTKREMATIIQALENQYMDSLRVINNPSNYLPSIIKGVKDRNELIQKLLPELRQKLK